MPLFEIPYTWYISGEDRQLVEASNKKEAIEVFNRNGGQHINFKKLEPQALHIEQATDAHPYFSQLLLDEAGDEDVIIVDSDPQEIQLSDGYDSDG